MEKQSDIHVRAPLYLKQKAQEEATRQERPLTWVIIKALEAYLQNKGNAP